MKIIKCELPQTFENIEIHAIGDTHLGDRLSDFQHLQNELKYIAETPNAYCILMGDLMDSAIAASVGDTYGAKLSPMEQMKQACAIFSPVAGKVLGVVPGNHERRIYKQDGIDLTQLFCSQLGIADKYSDTTALLFIRFGKDQRRSHGHRRQTCFTAYITHGSGCGKREGGKINRLADLSNIVDADLYITAHTHLPATFRTGYFRVSLTNYSVMQVDKVFVNTAATLDYGGYGDIAGFKPSSKENPVIHLNNRHQIKVTL